MLQNTRNTRYERFSYRCYECTKDTASAYFRSDSTRVLCKACAGEGLGVSKIVMGVMGMIAGVIGLVVAKLRGVL